MTGFTVVRFNFESLKGYHGKYLLKQLCMSFSLDGEEYSLCEMFALDTGSSFTILRQSVFEQVVEDLSDHVLPTIKISGYGDEKNTAPYIRDVDISVGGPTLLSLKKLVLSAEINLKPFSLLGTDALEHFCMIFDPEQEYAVLIPKQIGT